MRTSDRLELPLHRFAVAAACAVVLVFVSRSAQAAPPQGNAGGAGVVDGSAFADLATDQDSVVEVHLSGALLSTLASIDTEEEGLGELMRGLKSIEAYVVHIGDDAARADKAFRLVHDTELKLERQGWERIARVREKTSNVGIFVRHSEPYIDGLVVLVVDREEGQVVFANIAGRIDLARIGELSRMVDVPGLGSLGSAGKSSAHPRSSGTEEPPPPPRHDE
jgi:hypothetical protein